MNRKNEKIFNSLNKNTPFLRIFGLLILSFSFLLIINQRNANEISRYGVQNEAIIEYCNFESFIDNAKSQKRISFYRIGIQYSYEGESYSATKELQVNEFKEKIGRKLERGDKIIIQHSKRHPRKVEIIKQK